MLDEARHEGLGRGARRRVVVLALMLGAAGCSLPSAAFAQASAPAASTDGAQATGPTSARVSGNADPEGAATTLHADYAPASQPWCASDGREGTPTETLPEELGSGNVMYSELLVTLEGLTSGIEYCAELVASNEAGTTYGGQRHFTTPAQAATSPQVATAEAEATGPTSARVSGNADPEGAATTLHADYAPVSQPWCTSDGATGAPLETASEELGSGDVMYSELVVGLEELTPGVEYCAELVAANEAGTSYGGQRDFTTPSPIVVPPLGVTTPPGSLTPMRPTTISPFGQVSKPQHLTKAQRLAKALRACLRKRGRPRATCEKRARESYAAAAGKTVRHAREANK